MVAFFALEAVNRNPGTASSLQTSGDDRRTTREIGVAYALSAELPVVARRLPIPDLPRSAGPAGPMIQAAGLALRTWSMRTLGASYTRTLRAGEEQQVIDDGPYRWVRHPGYAGSLLIWIGYALTSRSVPALVLVSVLLGRVYSRRVATEEVLLDRDLPGYVDYRTRTKKLVPFIW